MNDLFDGPDVITDTSFHRWWNPGTLEPWNPEPSFQSASISASLEIVGLFLSKEAGL